MGFPDGSDGKEAACSAGDPGLIPGWEDPWRREWLPTPVFLPGESHGQWSLVGDRATVHGIAKAWTCLSDQHSLFTFQALC